MTFKTVIAAALTFSLIPCAVLAEDENNFTDKFPVEDCEFIPESKNPYFTLKPGRQLYLSNYRCVDSGECDELEEVWITVLNKKRHIQLNLDGVTKTVKTRVVQEYEMKDGEVAEISRNYFAECKGTQDVYYFGEDVDIYEDGEVVSHDGAWLAGVDGAQPGIIMPGGAFLLGSRYYQEIAPGVAQDRAEHVGDDLEAEVPVGIFEDCVAIDETTPLEPGAVSSKVYCPGVGLVVDDDVELVAKYGHHQRNNND